VVVFHETDASFNVGVYLSRSEKYVFIETGELERGSLSLSQLSWKVLPLAAMFFKATSQLRCYPRLSDLST